DERVRRAPTPFHTTASFPCRTGGRETGWNRPASLWCCFRSAVLRVPGLRFRRGRRILLLVDGPLVFETGHGHRAVSLVEIHQPHALRRTADDGDPARPGSQNHALLRDEHQLLVVEDAGDAHHLAIPLGGLDVDDAVAAAALDPVLVDDRALAVAVLGHGQNRAAGPQHLHADDLIPRPERDAPHAVC